MRATLLAWTLPSLLVAAALAFPSATADPIPCAGDPLPPEVQGCLAEWCVSWSDACFDPHDPQVRPFVEWVRDLFGPCTCDPRPEPW